MILSAETFFDIEGFVHKELFNSEDHVWCALKSLKSYMDDQPYPEIPAGLVTTDQPLQKTIIYFDGSFLDSEGMTIEFGDATKGKLKVFRNGQELSGASVIMAGTVLSGKQFQFGKGVLVESGALIKSPAIIGDMTEVRQGAYLRGYCLIGARCVVGHVTEVKHSIFLDDAKAGHFAYLGDSILGNDVNLGAGTKLANLRFASGDVQVKTKEGPISTGLRKLGAIFGDKTQTGCNSVTNPGTLLGKKSIVMPNTTAPSGYHSNSSLIR